MDLASIKAAAVMSKGVTLLETTINYGALRRNVWSNWRNSNAPGVDASVVYQKSLPESEHCL